MALAIFLGAIRSFGTKKDGTPFDNSIVHVALPVEDVARGNFNSTGYGLEVTRYWCRDNTVVEQFADIEVLDEIDLLIDVDIRSSRQQCVGVKAL